MEVLLYPYLPLRERSAAGAWELVPTAEFLGDDCSDTDRADDVRGLAGLYRLPDGGVQLGALARPSDGRIGDAIDRARMVVLDRAVLIALLAGNPDFLAADPDGLGNEGHMAATADNAVSFGHPIGDDGYVAFDVGGVARTIVGGINVRRDRNKIPYPVELRAPMLGRPVDSYYLNAAAEFLARDDDQSRRVGTAIDWLGLAWRNTTSLRAELRIMALKSGFETLLDSDAVETLRERLSELIDPGDARRAERAWTTRAGNPARADLTDLEWWFTQFTFLRNKIAHGDPISQDDLTYEDGQAHFLLAELRLRQAIAELIARAGYPDLREEWSIRLIRNTFREAGWDPDTGQPPS